MVTKLETAILKVYTPKRKGLYVPENPDLVFSKIKNTSTMKNYDYALVDFIVKEYYPAIKKLVKDKKLERTSTFLRNGRKKIIYRTLK